MISFSHKKFPCAWMSLAALFFWAGLSFVSCEQAPGTVLDGDAALKSLSVSAGTLNPAFSASHFAYSVTVSNAVDSITVTAAANSGKAEVSGAGTKTLNVGGNTVTIGVKAENGASKNYTITVTRRDASRIIEIKNADDMAKIGDDPDYPLYENYVLKNDITLTDWPPIGDKTTPFSGEFDGNGKTITLNGFAAAAVSGPASENYLGIFGYVKGDALAKAEIKDLKIISSVNASTEAEKQAIGLLAGCAEFAEIDNITLSGTFTYQSTNMILLGVVAGWIQGDTVVKNSTSSVTMDISPGNGNGLLGSDALGWYSYVGGIAGVFGNGAGIANCHKTGDVTAASDVSGSQIFAGGIAGGSEYVSDSNTAYTTYAYRGFIEDSSYNGTIIGKSKGFWVFLGGIAGTIYGGDGTTLAGSTRILRCSAAGTVSAGGTSSGFPYVGGVVGYNYVGAITAQSWFNGTVIADKANDYTGGIAGYNSQSSTFAARVEDCWSAGLVQGFNNAGGIVGQNQTGTYIRRCYSIAEVKTTAETGSGNTGVGGIAGLQASVQTDAVTACVALNPSLSAARSGYTNIHRITGAGANAVARSNNYALPGMTVKAGGVDVTLGAKGAAEAEGADIPAVNDKPERSFYEGLDWDFTNVWKMGSADDYPSLKWQP